MGRPRLPDEVKIARGTFRPSRAAGSTPTGRQWPVRHPACRDVELQDEAVSELHRLYDAVTANWVVDGQVNPLLSELAKMERVCVANKVIQPTKMSILLSGIAEGIRSR